MLEAFKPLIRAVLNMGRRFSGTRTATVSELARIRRIMSEQVLDCEVRVARRVRAHLDGASSAMQLWLLRAEIYQAVSDQFGQQEAMRRVERLAPLFEGLLPANQLRGN
ncbi:MAG: hypothetical protein Q4G70_06535 [Pseudomonadota bacterium]|nr:hypothetical protein [Pseudomonadota bacterium]